MGVNMTGEGVSITGVSINNPVCFIQFLYELLFLWQLLLYPCNEFGPENCGKVFYPEQKYFSAVRCLYLFPLPFKINTPTWHNAMDMRMQGQALSPGVQDGYHTRFSLQLSVRELSNCFPCAGKQDVVKYYRVMKKKTVQRIRNRKNYMKVWNR